MNYGQRLKRNEKKELLMLLKELKNQIDSGMLDFGITFHLPKYTYAAQANNDNAGPTNRVHLKFDKKFLS